MVAVAGTSPRYTGQSIVVCANILRDRLRLLSGGDKAQGKGAEQEHGLHDKTHSCDVMRVFSEKWITMIDEDGKRSQEEKRNIQLVLLFDFLYEDADSSQLPSEQSVGNFVEETETRNMHILVELGKGAKNVPVAIPIGQNF